MGVERSSSSLFFNLELLVRVLGERMEELSSEYEQLSHNIVRVLGEQMEELSSEYKQLSHSIQNVESALQRLAYATDLPRTVGLPDRLSFYYADFENRFRGTETVIRLRQERWLKLLESNLRSLRAKLVDLGCGRGEWLGLLRDHNIPALGIDIDSNLAEMAQTKGVEVLNQDIFHWISDQPDNSVGFYTAFQVVEHLSFQELTQLLLEMYRTLNPGGGIALETLNPTSFSAYQWFLLDPTHRKFMHFETLKWIAESIGFIDVQVVFAEPPARLNLDSRVARQIDDVLNGPIDYLIVATKMGGNSE